MHLVRDAATVALFPRHRIAGKPDRIVPMPARSGGPPFERHEYFFKDRSIIVTVREGRVTGIADNRIIQRP